MDRSKIAESEGTFVLPTPSHCMNVGIAINGNKNSKYIVRWALDKFVPEGNFAVKLIHVRSKIVAVPTASKLCFISFFFCSEIEENLLSCITLKFVLTYC